MSALGKYDVDTNDDGIPDWLDRRGEKPTPTTEPTETASVKLDAGEVKAPYPLHPLCELFPEIEGPAFDELVASIKENGLQEPIVLLDGAILDGRNRYNACIAAG